MPLGDRNPVYRQNKYLVEHKALVATTTTGFTQPNTRSLQASVLVLKLLLSLKYHK